MSYVSQIGKLIRKLKDGEEYTKFKESVIRQFKENNYRRLPYYVSEESNFPGLKILSDKKHTKDKISFLYKYVSEKVIRCIFSSNGGIRFCEPTQWNDKYESIFYRSEKCLSDDLKPNMVYASCFTTKRENEAAWYPAAGYREPQYGGRNLRRLHLLLVLYFKW